MVSNEEMDLKITAQVEVTMILKLRKKFIY